MGARWGGVLRLDNDIRTGITAARRHSHQGRCPWPHAEGEDIQAYKWKGTGLRADIQICLTWNSGASVSPSPTSSTNLTLWLLLIHLTISLLLEHASTLPQGLCTYRLSVWNALHVWFNWRTFSFHQVSAQTYSLQRNLSWPSPSLSVPEPSLVFAVFLFCLFSLPALITSSY